MTNPISDELNRMQLTFASLVNELNSSTHQQTQQRHDEETPVVNQQPQMPGGFIFPPNQSDTSTNTTTNNISLDEPMITKKINKIMLIIFTSILLVILIPLYLIYRVFICIFFIIVSIYIKVQRYGYKPLRSNDPTDIAKRFTIRFDERIGNRSKNVTTNNGNDENDQQNVNLISESHLVEIDRPDFLECAYSHALYIMKKDVRWLLCYIESNENKESIEFTNNVLINEKFLKFISDRKFLIWGGDISDSEAFQICNQFNITKLPFLGLLCLTVNQIPTSSGMQQSTPVLSLVSKSQGYKSLDATLKKLDRAYRKYNPIVLQLQLAASTPQSPFRDITSQAVENAIRRTQHLLEQRNLQALELQWLKWRKSRIAPESNESGEYTRIAIKIPSGIRKEYKINKNLSLEEIYAITACDLLNNIEISESETYEEPRNYNHEYKFDIFTAFPRTPLEADTNIHIYENPALFPSGNLIVEMRDV